MKDKDLMILVNGFEDIRNYNHYTADCKYVTSLYNISIGKDVNRPISEVIEQDGMESITSFISETFIKTITTVKSWFNDYGKDEITRIKKEFPKGIETFKANTLSDMVKELNGIIDRLKQVKGSENREKVEKAINICNLAIGRLKNNSNPHETDRLIDQIRGELEKYASKMFAKQYWFNQVNTQFKKLDQQKVLKEMAFEFGSLKESFFNDGLKETNKIIKKMETIRNTGNKFYDIQKTGIVKDISNFIINFLEAALAMYSNILRLDKNISRYKNDEELTVSSTGRTYTVADIRRYIFFIYNMTKDLVDAIEDVEREFKSATRKAYLSSAGLNNEEVDQLVEIMYKNK